MGIRAWWTSRRRRRADEAEREARERDAAEAEAARRRVIELAQREREERDQQTMPSWVGPTRIDLPLLTYGQACLYRTGSAR